VCWCISNVKQMNCHVKFWMVRSLIWFWNNLFVWKKLITHGLQSSFRWYPTLSISETERMTLLTIRFCGHCSFGKQGAKWWFHAKGKFINSLLMQTLHEVPAFFTCSSGFARTQSYGCSFQPNRERYINNTGLNLKKIIYTAHNWWINLEKP
jgi:hypothetical protein